MSELALWLFVTFVASLVIVAFGLVPLLVAAGAVLTMNWLMLPDKCPKCGRRMVEVYGWDKQECPACGYSKKW